ncbi:MAG: DNA recombination protein RmuC [Bacteroidales bacterium]|nr:DNA recombination protein RmuC [Bacteroidales bacterium]MBQ9702235.1 DNA recombination protein RmuC [Bacteroidales bacterium]MBR1782693.1 DNA recombination protein RmuC [Bacteroidales bacterium]
MELVIIAAAVAVVLAVVITWLIMHAQEVKACNALENQLIAARKDLENADKLQKMQQESFSQQLEAVRSQLSAETEKLLKQREEALQKKAEETFRALAGPLGKDLKAMQESFDAQKRSQTEGTASLKTAMDEAVKNLRDQTSAIGSKADNLAQALKGQNKMAGTWGEVILYNMLMNEGMEEGRDFDREETLRDAMGSVVYNEDSGKRMRPDYILHYPDKTEVIIDAKTSMEALSDWFAAQDEATKENAAQRNLQAIRAQIKSLSGKRYQDYIRDGYKTLDYVIMFIPNYSSLQLAKTLAPNIFSEAYRQGVLLTTEETLMPFLRMIRLAWTNYDQARNQEKIIKAAQTMVDRVYDFSKAHAAMGDKLHAALEEYDKVSLKIGESGNSILTSARQLIQLGVPKNPKKPLPEGD